MKEEDECKLKDAAKSNGETTVEKERSRNSQLWNGKEAGSESKISSSSTDRVNDQEASHTHEGSGKVDSYISQPELQRTEAPTAEKIGAMIDEAWERRETPGRFSTDGKSAVLWSGYSTASEHRMDSLGKDGPVYSKDLADRHVSQNQDTHITLGQTHGGMELEKIQAWIDSDIVSGSERKELDDRLNSVWRDASQRFAESAAKNVSSIAYVENARDTSVYKETERITIESAQNHRHLTDKPLVDGHPPQEDKVLPNDLDQNGRYYKA